MERLKSRWIALVASIWIQCSCGDTYTFGIYSSALKSSQSYDQSTLDTVSVFKDIGGSAGFLSGLLYTAVVGDYPRGGRVSSRLRRPWVVLLVGALQYFAGFFFMWLSVVGLIQTPPLPLMCFFMFLAAHAQTYYSTTNVVSAVQNFSDYGGTAVGIMKGFMGLSGAILIQLYQTVCDGNPATYILLLAITPTLLALLLMPLVRIYDVKSVDDKKHLDRLSVISILICLYLMVAIVLENAFSFSRWTQASVFVVTIFLLVLPLWVADKAQKEEKERFKPLDFPSTERTSLITRPKPVEDMLETGLRDNKTRRTGEDMNPLQAMRTINFLLLFLATVCGMGSGLATINNIRQIGESLRYSTIELNSLVSLWSIWNFIGRLGAGYISDMYMRRKGCPRPFFMAITLAVMSIGHLIIASGLKGNIYIGSILVGIAYGAQWSLMPISMELFGIQHLGTIYNTIALASPVGSYIFSVRLIGYVYNKMASDDDNACYGSHCFMSAFFIMASMAFVGVLISCVLSFRTTTVYRQIVEKRMTK